MRDVVFEIIIPARVRACGLRGRRWARGRCREDRHWGGQHVPYRPPLSKEAASGADSCPSNRSRSAVQGALRLLRKAPGPRSGTAQGEPDRVSKCRPTACYVGRQDRDADAPRRGCCPRETVRRRFIYVRRSDSAHPGFERYPTWRDASWNSLSTASIYRCVTLVEKACSSAPSATSTGSLG